MPKCQINGKEIEVPQGSTIIQAFRQLEEDIAHYCWHPGLSVAGVCRLCMVEIEGQQRLQIACNTPVQEGMVVTNQSEKVKDAVKWGLDFHLINHPLDCPICDQAGECGLQDQYMKFGKYDAQMGQRKVKKQKVVDLGPQVVLDSERCILCSRCVRFTEEVSKTHELGIFQRGDRSEIGTFANRPLDNKYSLNTVDICPVGALTSKDFRFRQRVWFLKEKPSVCTGCSTGCSIQVSYNEEGVWRVKPRYNPQVNGYWMCDEGRQIYKATNQLSTEFIGERDERKLLKKENRLQWALSYVPHREEVQERDPQERLEEWGQELKKYKKVALVVTGQYTNEEYGSFLDFWKSQMGGENIFHWTNHPNQMKDFDGLLVRGDKNANTKGLDKVIKKRKLNVSQKISSMDSFDLVVVLGPENLWTFDDVGSKFSLFCASGRVIWFSACRVLEAEKLLNKERELRPLEIDFIPLKTTMEKSGTLTNHSGLEQEISPLDAFVPGALSLCEVIQVWSGGSVDFSEKSLCQEGPVDSVTNEFVYQRGVL